MMIHFMYNTLGRAGFLIVLIHSIGIMLSAQDLSFDVSAPGVVRTNEQFKITYSFNQNAQLPMPDFGAFSYRGGPSRGQSSYTSIVNGQVTSESSYTYTYYIQAPENPGEYTIPAAQATYGNKTYTSENLTIEVVAGGQSSSSGGTPSSPEDSKSEAYFLAVDLDKTVVFKGEPVTAWIRLYTDPNLMTQLATVNDYEYIQPPKFPGFYRQDIESDGNISKRRANVNNSVLNVYDIQQVVLYPQETGEISIDPVELRFIAIRIVRDPVFGSRYAQAIVSAKSARKTITVKALPEDVSSFGTDAVGIFTIDSKLSSDSMSVNDAFALTIDITGTGNVKFIDALRGQLPDVFEVSGPHREVFMNKDQKSGRASFEYDVVARQPGIFTIEPFAFTYFDNNTKKYNTIRTETYTIKVTEGEGTDQLIVYGGGAASYPKKVEVIRFIRKETSLREKDRFIFGRSWFYQIYLGSFLLFLTVLIVRREQLRRSADLVRYKKRRAGKVVSKRLRKARKLLRSNNIEAYYDELERALWGYLSDKMNMPISELSVENVQTEMISRHIDERIASDFTDLIQNCQFARYAPGGMEAQMGDLFEKARVLINKLDQKL